MLDRAKRCARGSMGGEGRVGGEGKEGRKEAAEEGERRDGGEGRVERRTGEGREGREGGRPKEEGTEEGEGMEEIECALRELSLPEARADLLSTHASRLYEAGDFSRALAALSTAIAGLPSPSPSLLAKRSACHAANRQYEERPHHICSRHLLPSTSLPPSPVPPSQLPPSLRKASSFATPSLLRLNPFFPPHTLPPSFSLTCLALPAGLPASLPSSFPPCMRPSVRPYLPLLLSP